MPKAYGVLPIQAALPAVPTGITLDEVTAGTVVCFWTDAGDATSWTVYWDGAPIGSPVTVAGAALVGLSPPGSLHSLQVQANNSAGASALSASLPVTLAANSPPSWSLLDQAGILGAAYSLDLNTECSDADGHSLSYSIVSGSLPPGVSRNGALVSGTPSAAGAYPVTFRAGDGYGTADTSITFTISDPDHTAPTVPSNVAASANGSTVTVTFTASTDASGVSHYRVFRGGVFRSNSSASPYVETGVANGTYTYSVSAVDASANANESAQGSATPVVVSVAPPNPDVPVYAQPVVVSSSQINHAWTAGPSGPAPTSYELDRSLTGTGGWTNRFTGLALTFSDTGLAASTQYFYRLRALNGVVASGYVTQNATTGSSALLSLRVEEDFTQQPEQAFTANLFILPDYYSTVGCRWRTQMDYNPAVAVPAGNQILAITSTNPLGTGQGKHIRAYMKKDANLGMTKRCELNLQDASGNGVLVDSWTANGGSIQGTKEYWYGFRVRLDEVYYASKGNSVGGYFCQWHDRTVSTPYYGQDLNINPPMSLVFNPSSDSLSLRYEKPNEEAPSTILYQLFGSAGSGNPANYSLGPIPVGECIDVMVKVSWSYVKNFGYTYIWINDYPNPVNQRVNLSNAHGVTPSIPYFRWPMYFSGYQYSGSGTVGDYTGVSADQFRMIGPGLPAGATQAQALASVKPRGSRT